jgi:transcriptional regulator with AAA-type ATPase domain
MPDDVQTTFKIESDQTSEEDAPPALLIRIGCSARACRPEPLFVPLFSHAEVRLGGGTHDELDSPEPTVARQTVADRSMSRQHAQVLRLVSPDRWMYVLGDLDSTNGCRVNGVLISEPRPLTHGDVIETGRTFWRFWHRPVSQLDTLLARAYGGGEVEFTSSLCLDLLDTVTRLEQIAASDLPVIVCGESGTGKEGMATELHRLSKRSGPFVALNCAAVPEGLMESELFGHCKGAFSGAVADKRGLIEAAAGGTLLLDEVGDMPLPLQAKLLRVLQGRTLTRVGETTPRQVDVRFVAATHRDLRQMTKESAFRGDLFARLNGLTINLPPLRERREDLGLLLTTFLARADAGDKQVAHAFFRALTLHDWPFNIRELERAVGVAVAFCGDHPKLGREHLPQEVRDAARAVLAPGATPMPASHRPPPAAQKRTAKRRRSRPTAATLTAALEQHNGNISAVARELRTTRMQVHRWLQHYDIDPDTYRR